MMREFKFIIEKEDEAMPIRRMLKKHLRFSSRLLARLKAQKRVFLNGVPFEGWMKYKAGDEVLVLLPEEESHFPPEDIPIDMRYEDEDIGIINKQPGVTVHPTKGHASHTIANGLMKYMQEHGSSFKIRFVNRLDMDTSGLLIVGKNSNAQAALVAEMGKGTLEKEYVAILKGLVEPEEMTIDEPIGHPDPEAVCRSVVHDGSGRPSVTHLKVLKRYAAGFTLVRLKLETGRTHQIRVHTSYIGHPVAGDALYGGEAPGFIDRQALHAEHLRFRHPAEDRIIDITAPLPADMQQMLEKLEQMEAGASKE